MRSRHTTQYGHGGFHGQPVTSLPHSAVSGSSSVTMWQISSPWFVGPSTRRSLGTVGDMAPTQGATATAGPPLLRSRLVQSAALRARSSVGERSLHTREVAGS